jgi:hypothetical protein
VTAPYRRTTTESALGNHSDRLGILEAVPQFASYEIKVISDFNYVSTWDSSFIFCIPADLNGAGLLDAQAFVTQSNSSLPDVQVQIYNRTDAVYMLSTPITIDVGELTSYTAAVPPVIDATADDVATADMIEIIIQSAGGGNDGPDAMGLGVILKFSVFAFGA